MFRIFWYHFLSKEKQLAIWFAVVLAEDERSSRNHVAVFTVSVSKQPQVCNIFQGDVTTLPTQFQKLLSFSAIFNFYQIKY